MQRGTKMSVETKKILSDSAKSRFESGESVSPTLTMKDKLNSHEKRIEELEAKVTALDDWKRGIKEVLMAHDRIVQVALTKPDNPIGVFVADLLKKLQE